MHLRLFTYNVHKCIGGFDRKYRPARITSVIANHVPDIVMLQEVDREAKRSLFHDQVEVLGEMLGLRHRTWFPNVQLLMQRGSYGNAILSRFPITETSNVDLTVPPKKRRSALHARLRVRMGTRTRTVHVFNLHLGLSGLERKLQLRRLLASPEFTKLHERTPIVVAGDLNDVYGTLGAKVLSPAGFRGQSKPALTYPSPAPIRALDAVYVRGSIKLVRVHASQLIVARSASDHLPLVIEAELT